MKTFVLSMISIAATVAAMTACTSESEEINEVVEAPVEIQARAGVGSITTKASMETWSTAGDDVFFCKAPDHETTANWATATPLFAKIDKDGNITFYEEAARTTVKKQYYNANENLKSWIAGCYLGNATISGSGTTLTNNTVSFTITGQEDIMATDGKDGTKKTHFADFTFKHLLSNLSFVITPKDVNDLASIKSTFGNVTNIEVLDQPQLLDLTLAATPTLEINSGNSNNKLGLTGNVEIAENASYGEIMIFPTTDAGKTNKEINIIVHTEKSPTAGIPVKVLIDGGNSGLAANTKYKVTLTFSATDIAATASIGKWTESNGSGSVE